MLSALRRVARPAAARSFAAYTPARTWQVYLSGEIHSDWREVIAAGVADRELPVELAAPITSHEDSDDCGAVILGDEASRPNYDGRARGSTSSASGGKRAVPDVRGAELDRRTRTLIDAADVVVVRFGDKYRQWNAAFDAGYATARGKALHDPVDAPQPRARRAAAGTTIKRKLSGAGAAMPKQRVGLRRELAGAPRTREGFSRTFLLRFICEKHTLSFRYAELDALLAAHGVDPSGLRGARRRRRRSGSRRRRVPVRGLLRGGRVKAILVRDALEVWGEGDDHAACARGRPLAPGERGAVLRRRRVVEARRGFYKDALPFRGRVRLKGADEQFRILEVYGDVNRGGPRPAPSRCYFGRVVACSAARDLVHKCDLKRRIYLGPTALDNELALVMANCARCDVGSLVLDPFAGTGSILVACALFGGFCYGSDIDWKVLRGKGEHENDGATRRRGMRPRKSASLPVDALQREDGHQKTLFSNFRQYGLAPPEILRLGEPPLRLLPNQLAGPSTASSATRPTASARARAAPARPATTSGRAGPPRGPRVLTALPVAGPVSAKYARHLVVMAKARPWGAADWTPAARALVKQSVDAPYENAARNSRSQLASRSQRRRRRAPAPAPGRCGVM
ncbi:tRNA (guanine-N2-)-methyltransferase [Aureococcus anophagefferens]|nr:tRNA (guanine-N2-)-methyltransferase [Aureococcus anophagefferens]